MLSDEIIEVLSERLVNRIEQANTYILSIIGSNIKKIGALNEKEMYQLEQILKFGGDYDKITKKLAEISKLNIQDIYKIFEESAKKEYMFAKKFYDYRSKKFIPYEENTALQTQVQAIADLTASTYLNISGTLGYSLATSTSFTAFTELSKVYQTVIDRGILTVSQGKEIFNNEMYRIIKQLGASGLKTVDYASGRSMRLDSAVRMNLKDGLRTLHTETQKVVGEEFGHDGVEITVHSYPAPDHEKVQGRQFGIEEFNRLQNGETVKDYKKKEYSLVYGKNDNYRPISKLNCYHTVFSIILGVTDPQYSDEYLEQVIEDNNKGFEFENKHYTMYEGTQLQRKIELEVRKTKDIEQMAMFSINSKEDSKIKDLISNCESKNRLLMQKYKDLCKISGLKSKTDRMRVANIDY